MTGMPSVRHASGLLRLSFPLLSGHHPSLARDDEVAPSRSVECNGVEHHFNPCGQPGI